MSGPFMITACGVGSGGQAVQGQNHGCNLGFIQAIRQSKHTHSLLVHITGPQVQLAGLEG